MATIKPYFIKLEKVNLVLRTKKLGYFSRLKAVQTNKKEILLNLVPKFIVTISCKHVNRISCYQSSMFSKMVRLIESAIIKTFV